MSTRQQLVGAVLTALTLSSVGCAAPTDETAQASHDAVTATDDLKLQLADLRTGLEGAILSVDRSVRFEVQPRSRSGDYTYTRVGAFDILMGWAPGARCELLRPYGDYATKELPVEAPSTFKIGSLDVVDKDGHSKIYRGRLQPVVAEPLYLRASLYRLVDGVETLDSPRLRIQCFDGKIDSLPTIEMIRDAVNAPGNMETTLETLGSYRSN